jgi:hypothetical protein
VFRPTAEPRCSLRISTGPLGCLVMEGDASRLSTPIRFMAVSSTRRGSRRSRSRRGRSLLTQATLSAVRRPRKRRQSLLGHQDRSTQTDPSLEEGVAGSARQLFFEDPCLTPALGRKLKLIASASPRLCAALSPTRSASNGYGQRISPVGEADIPREANSPPFAVLRMRCGPSGAGRPGRAFLCRYPRGCAGDGPAAHGAR